MLKENTKVEEFKMDGNLNKAFNVDETKLDNSLYSFQLILFILFKERIIFPKKISVSIYESVTKIQNKSFIFFANLILEMFLFMKNLGKLI